MTSPRGPRPKLPFRKQIAQLHAQVATLEEQDALEGFVAMAHALKEAGHLNEALAVAAEGLTVFKNAPGAVRAEAFNILGQIFQHLDQPREATQAHEQMAAIAEAIGSAYLQSAACFALGAIQHTQGNATQARTFYAQAFRHLRREPEVRLQVQILLNLADLRLGAGDTTAARELYASASELIDALGDHHLEASLQLGIGKSHAVDHSYQAAAVAYELAFRKARQAGLLPLQLAATQSLGAANIDLARPREARRWYEKGLKLATRYAGNQQRIALLRGAAAACLGAKHRLAAVDYLRAAARLALYAKDETSWTLTMLDLTRLALGNGKIKDAKSLLHKIRATASTSRVNEVRDGYWLSALEIATITKNPKDEIDAVLKEASEVDAMSPSLLSAAAEHLAHHGDYGRAAELAEQGLARRGLRGHERAWAQAQIGAQLSSVGGARDAVRFFSAAARSYARSGDKQLLFKCKNDLANAHADLGKYSLAIKGYRACATLGRQLGDRAMVAQALQNWSETIRRQRKPTEALQLLRRARELYQELGDVTGTASTQATLGLILTDLDRNSEAVAAFKNCLKVAPRDRIDTQAVALGGLATLDTAAGRYRSAIKFYSRAIAIEEAAQDLSHEMESRAGILIAFAGVGDHRNTSRTMKRLSFLLGRVGRSDLASWATREAATAALDRGHRKLGLELMAVWVVLGFAERGPMKAVTTAVGGRIANAAIELVRRYHPRFRQPLRAVARYAARQVGKPIDALLRTTFTAAEGHAEIQLAKYGPPKPLSRHTKRARRRR